MQSVHANATFTAAAVLGRATLQRAQAAHIPFVCMQTQHMSALQLFRATLAALSAPRPGAAITAHLATSPCVQLDSSGHVNLLATVPASAWSALLDCAQATLAALAAPHVPASTVVRLAFPARAHQSVAYDAMLTVRLKKAQSAGAGPLAADLPSSSVQALRAERLLVRALTTRVVRLAVWSPPPDTVSVSDDTLPGTQELVLHVVLTLDPKEVRVNVHAHVHVRTLVDFEVQLKRLHQQLFVRPVCSHADVRQTCRCEPLL